MRHPLCISLGMGRKRVKGIVYKIRYTIQNIDIRNNAWYHMFMIRKGDTKDANDTERDDKTS